ncbi:MAG: hypothetical protein PHW73_00605 [Atribacterota bacterium]|nr:hypothetical protein [Atribacterota bacterium]
MRKIDNRIAEFLVMILAGIILYIGIKTVGFRYTIVLAISFLYGKVMLIDINKKDKHE